MLYHAHARPQQHFIIFVIASLLAIFILRDKTATRQRGRERERERERDNAD